MQRSLHKSQGQVVLMVLLASALVLTLGLSAAKQATIETSIDTDQEMLKKAFNSAESAIEYYLKTGNKQYGDVNSVDGAATLETTSINNGNVLSFNHILDYGTPDFFWLVNHTDTGDIGTTYYSDTDPTIDICSEDKTSVVYFKVDYFYKEGVDYKVRRGSGDGAVLPTSGGTPNCISDYSLLPGKSILIAVTPMRGVNTKVSLRGGGSFPIQGERIISTGSVGKVNNSVVIDRPYELLSMPFLLEPVVINGSVTN